MTNEHLHDGQIQEILDKLMFQPGQSPAPHLESCASCRERFEQYKRLYAGLSADPDFVLPPTFADSIIKKLPVPRRAFWAQPAVRISLAVSAGALILAGLFIFVNMQPLASGAMRILTSMADAFRPLLNQYRQLFAKLNDQAGLFILGGLGLLSAAFFDQFLQRQILRRSR